MSTISPSTSPRSPSGNARGNPPTVDSFGKGNTAHSVAWKATAILGGGAFLTLSASLILRIGNLATMIFTSLTLLFSLSLYVAVQAFRSLSKEDQLVEKYKNLLQEQATLVFTKLSELYTQSITTIFNGIFPQENIEEIE